MKARIPAPETIVNLDDILIVQGDGDNVGHAAALYNLGIQPAQQDDEESLVSDEVGLAEILLPPPINDAGKDFN